MTLNEPTTVELRLPWPPTVNHYWRTAVRGKGAKARVVTYVSNDGVEYRKAVYGAVPDSARRKFSGRLALTLTAYPPDLRRRDLDNTLKATLDALAHAGVYLDDGQIDSLVIERREPVRGGALGVVVQEVAL